MPWCLLKSDLTPFLWTYSDCKQASKSAEPCARNKGTRISGGRATYLSRFYLRGNMPQNPLNWKDDGPQSRTGCFEETTFLCRGSIHDSRDQLKGTGYVSSGLVFKNCAFFFKVFCLFHMILITKHFHRLWQFSFTAYEWVWYCTACLWPTHNSGMVSGKCTGLVD